MGEWIQNLPVGWMTVESTNAQDVGGDVNWSKAPLFNTKLYPGGFVVKRQLSGSIYSAPPKGVSILNLPNGQVLFEGADLQQSFSEPIALDANNRVTDLGSNKLNLFFKPVDGSFSGRYEWRHQCRSWAKQLRIISDFGLLREDLVDTRQRRGAALKNIDYPAERDHGPGKLCHVGGKRNKLADAEFPLNHLASA